MRVIRPLSVAYKFTRSLQAERRGPWRLLEQVLDGVGGIGSQTKPSRRSVESDESSGVFSVTKELISSLNC